MRVHLRRGVRYGGNMMGGGRGDDAGGPPPVDTMPPPPPPATVPNDAQARLFTDSYLRHDGVFLLRLIAHNTNGITTTEITRELWDLWYDRNQSQLAQQQAHGKGVESNELKLLTDDHRRRD